VEKAIASDNCFDRLVALVETLRSDDGCPWDRAQTPEKIKIYLIEEAYEVLDAIESGTTEDVCDELGDVLFHIVLLARIFEEVGAFNTKDVIQSITEKMIRRHPHVFGEARVSSVDEVAEQWHEIKTTEAENKDFGRTALLDAIPKKLPALMRAYRLVKRASRAGFDWPDVSSVLAKVEEELDEFTIMLQEGGVRELGEKLGDLLFAVVSLGHFVEVHPETALTQAISKFVAQFEFVQETLRRQGRTMESASIEEMDRMWEERGK
jgi:tetrapyrrole methylase family protein/MazG family protein